MRINLTPELLEGLNLMKEASGMSFHEISEKTGIEKSTVSRYLSGKLKSIPHDKLLQILNVIGTAEEVQNIVEQYGIPVEPEDDYPRPVREMDEIKNEIEYLKEQNSALRKELDDEREKSEKRNQDGHEYIQIVAAALFVIIIALLLAKIFIH